ncbi:MAG: hypothetical protein FRX49_00951 [Trebouxia sp. A1-2]|nr:MAG: hypothetical protein FRX49_00951 [Trebouxia sp. A1-2]
MQEGQKALQQAHAEKGFIHLVGKQPTLQMIEQLISAQTNTCGEFPILCSHYIHNAEHVWRPGKTLDDENGSLKLGLAAVGFRRVTYVAIRPPHCILAMRQV